MLATKQLRHGLPIYLLSINLKIKMLHIPHNYNFTLLLYGSEICPLALREEHTVRVFQNGAEENIWT
jgi:hypothetical protein